MAISSFFVLSFALLIFPSFSFLLLALSLFSESARILRRKFSAFPLCLLLSLAEIELSNFLPKLSSKCSKARSSSELFAFSRFPSRLLSLWLPQFS